MKKENKGFSLIEVLAGVTILALVAGPLFHAMITSAQTMAKTRTLRNQTIAIENVIEKVKNLGLQGMMQDNQYIFYANADAAEQIQPETGEESYYIGIDNVHAGAADYKVLLTVKADAYQDLNQQEVVQYTPMDAVYSQSRIKSENSDFIAAEHMAAAIEEAYAEQMMDLDFTIDWTDCIRKMQRTNRLRIVDTPSEKGGYVSVYAQLRYTMQDDYGRSYTYQTEDYEFFREYYLQSRNQTAADVLQALYVFYYPNYYGDTILVYNQDNLPVSVFLIKEKPLADYGYGSYTTADSNYTPTLRFYETYDSKADSIARMEPCMKIFSNAGLRFDARLTQEKSATRTIYGTIFKGAWKKEIPISVSHLVDTESQNRLYAVQAELFDADKRYDTGNALLTMQTSLGG